MCVCVCVCVCACVSVYACVCVCVCVCHLINIAGQLNRDDPFIAKLKTENLG